ncbi:Uncharacterized protein PF11_0213 [Eumeta japonica]|uniref:Uncharacterized protein PF11_0213 n=1 Tax=Eumeta variegata TaxID=151549 RepID=A0A4C1THS5_EUMVA|nr:Uncharacterized protein PF11_0213 [Eumeta japonica]
MDSFTGLRVGMLGEDPEGEGLNASRPCIIGCDRTNPGPDASARNVGGRGGEFYFVKNRADGTESMWENWADTPFDFRRPVLPLLTPSPPPRHMDSVYMDSVYMDSVYMDSVYMDSVYMDSVYMDSVYMDSVYMDSVYMDSVYMDSVYMDSVYMDSVYMDSGDNLLSDDSLAGSPLDPPFTTRDKELRSNKKKKPKQRKINANRWTSAGPTELIIYRVPFRVIYLAGVADDRHRSPISAAIPHSLSHIILVSLYDTRLLAPVWVLIICVTQVRYTILQSPKFRASIHLELIPLPKKSHQCGGVLALNINRSRSRMRSNMEAFIDTEQLIPLQITQCSNRSAIFQNS